MYIIPPIKNQKKVFLLSELLIYFFSQTDLNSHQHVLELFRLLQSSFLQWYYPLKHQSLLNAYAKL